MSLYLEFKAIDFDGRVSIGQDAQDVRGELVVETNPPQAEKLIRRVIAMFCDEKGIPMSETEGTLAGVNKELSNAGYESEHSTRRDRS